MNRNPMRCICNNQQPIQRILSYCFMSSCPENIMRDNTHLFGSVISLYQTKTNPHSSMTISLAYANTLFAKFLELTLETPFTFNIDMPIMDNIISSNMCFNTDNHTDHMESYMNTLRSFKHHSNNDMSRYKVTRDHNSLQFGFITDFIATGLSFHQVEF